jgi:hypothetical protein
MRVSTTSGSLRVTTTSGFFLPIFPASLVYCSSAATEQLDSFCAEPAFIGY